MSGTVANDPAAIFAEARRDGRATLLESEGLDLFDTIGIATPARFVLPADGTTSGLDLGRLPGSRVVVKVLSPGILHKSDVGGVQIVEKTPAAIAAAVGDMSERLAGHDLRGWLVAEFVEYDRSLGGELLLGARATDDFGPIVTVGPGGVTTEFLTGHLRPGREVSVFAPRLATDATIREALSRQALVPLVTGGVRRLSPRISLDDLVDLVRRFVDFVERHVPVDLLELEINPIVLTERGPVAIDALARLGAGIASPPAGPAAAAPRPLEKLERLLAPESVAVVGVSEKVNPGHIIVHNLLREGFPRERLHVVKPGCQTLFGCPCVPDIASLPDPVDLLVLSIAAAQIPGAVEEAIATRRAETMIVIPGGLGETEGSVELVERMHAALAASRQTDWRGPLVNGGNCLGIRSRPGRVDTMFIPAYKLPPAGGEVAPVALVSQSGALAVARVSKLGAVNPRYVISVGNQIDLTLGDYFEWLARDGRIEVFACYAEGFRPGDGLRWLAAARSIVASGRDVILYRAGRTPAGRAATASHTASVAGDYTVTRELAESMGVVVAETLADFEDLLATFARLRGKRRDGGRRIAGFSNAGFEAVGIADALDGLELAELSTATVRRIESVLARHRLDGVVDVHNPMDVTPIMSDEPTEEVARALLDDPGVDAALLGCVPLTGALHTLPAGAEHGEDLDRNDSIVSRLVRLFRESEKPWVAVVDGGELYDPMARALEAGGVPTFRTADRAMRALGAWCRGRIAGGVCDGEESCL